MDNLNDRDRKNLEMVMEIQNQLSNKVNIDALDDLALHLSQAKAMAIVATSTDFESLKPGEIHDYWAIVVDLLEKADVLTSQFLAELRQEQGWC
jgi:hypothetical protein